MTIQQALIGYSRISTGNQRDGYGIEIQEDRIRAYAKERDVKLIRIFKDEAVSGAIKDRPALIELLNFAEQNKHTSLSLVFLRLDRLARDLLVQEGLIADFRKRGLQVISIEEPDLLSNDPTRKLFRQMKGMLAEYEKGIITARMSAGRIKKVEAGGGYAGGNVAFGFEVTGDKYRPIPREIAIVKEIMRLRRKPRQGNRLSYQKIANLLNERNTPAPVGHTWYANTVRYLCLNEMYKGIQHYSSAQFLHPALRITNC
jgi:DNA invertase Pin-like site-specific DNA recombinase